jgi:hypothetical protein
MASGKPFEGAGQISMIAPAIVRGEVDYRCESAASERAPRNNARRRSRGNRGKQGAATGVGSEKLCPGG